jgi:serine/threonine protein kinase
MQAALGLEHAHQSGLIHRDVKPGNVLVTPSGVAKVSDLGLAACVQEGEQDPRAGRVVGTPDYLSPEQLHNPHDVTKVTDIYSLGCTLYYAVTGKVPFPGGTASSKARRIREETPWHPRQFRPDISEEFVEVIADMMEKNPAKRIASAADVAARLEPWASDVSPILSRQLIRSPWTAPPLPMGNSITHDSSGLELEEVESSRQESTSHSSQGTFVNSISSQETRSERVASSVSVPLPPPLPIPDSSPSGQRDYLIMVLALAIPVSLAIGVLLGMVLYGWLA